MTNTLTVRPYHTSSSTISQEKPLEENKIRQVYGEISPVQIPVPIPYVTGVIDFPSLNIKATPDKIVIGTLPIDTLRLRQPIIASIDKENDQFIAYVSQIDEYGFGNSPMQAIDDLRMTVLELYLSLKEKKDKLGPGLMDTLKQLEEFIEEE